MANNFALITKYLQSAIDTVFATESKTNVLVNGSKYIDVNFKEAGYVKVMSLLMDGLSDYYRVNNGLTGSDYSNYPSSDGYKVGNVQSSWEIFKLRYDRGKQFQVDDMDNEEQAGLVIGNLLTEFLRTKVVPEVDATRFSIIASKASASLGNLTTETIGANQIIARFNEGFKWLTEHEVPAEEQVIFVSPDVMALIRNTNEISKFITQGDYKAENGIDFTIEKYSGRPIVEVPSNRFFTEVATTQNGYAPTNGKSKIINFMIVSKKAIVPVVKLEKSKTWTPDQVQDFDGYKVNIRLYHDAIIPANKIPGCYVSVSSTDATTKANLLSVDIAKSGDAYLLNASYTNPAGLLGRVVYATSKFTLGSTYTTSASVKEVVVGSTFTKIGTETKGYFGLIDANGLCIASSVEVTLPTA